MSPHALPPRAVLGLGNLGFTVPIIMLGILIYVVTTEQGRFSGRGR